MASRQASCLSVGNVPPAGQRPGTSQSHLRPPADRTACGACENVRSRAVILSVPTVDGPDRTSVTFRFDLHIWIGFVRAFARLQAIPAVFTRVRRREEDAVSTRFRPL